VVPLTSLWLPIVLSAVLVFAASFVVHMILPFHRSDYDKLPPEDQVMDALRGLGIPPGNYMMPHAGNPQAMKDPAFKEKWERGPRAFMIVHGSDFSMGKSLVQWFVYCLVASVFAAYVAGRAVGPGAEYLEVFRFAGTTAFVGYSLAQWQNSIWYRIKWSTTIKNNIDGLVYGLLTAGVFGWLWPGGAG
jgi:hypothetical protein